MAEGTGRGQVTFDESHVNIKLPNRCRRCHTYNEDPDAPTLRESFIILLHQMMRTPQNVCFLLCLSLPYFTFTGVALLLLVFAGHFTFAASLFHCGLLIFLIFFCVIKYFGHRYTKEYSAEQDLIQLNSSGIIHSTGWVLEAASGGRATGVYLVRQPRRGILKYLKDFFLW